MSLMPSGYSFVIICMTQIIVRHTGKKAAQDGTTVDLMHSVVAQVAIAVNDFMQSIDKSNVVFVQWNKYPKLKSRNMRLLILATYPAPRLGLEPRTLKLTASCSAIELSGIVKEQEVF